MNNFTILLNKRQVLLVPGNRPLIWIICSILAFLGNARISQGAEFADYLYMRELLQSPHGSKVSAREYNDPLNWQSSISFDNGMYSAVDFAVLAGEASAKFIKDHCQKTDASKKRCFEEFLGDPMAVLAIEQALATDDALKRDAEFYARVGIDKHQRQEFLENTYLAFKDSRFKESPNSPREQIRSRIRDLAGENRLKQLDEAAAVKPQSTLQNAKKKLATDVERAKEFTRSKFFPAQWESKTQEVLEKIERADATVKTGIRNIATTNLKFFTNAESASKFALKAAQLLGASKGDQANIAKIVDATEKGRKTFDALVTLGRAAAGDITAYINAAGTIASIFGGNGGGSTFQSQVMETLNAVLDNQKRMIQRLDFIIAQLDRVSHHLVDIHREIVIIDKNVRLLIEGQRELLSEDFLVCMQHSHTILTNKDVTNSVEKYGFDPYTYPYDKRVYQKIVEVGVKLEREHGWVGSCVQGVPQVFKGMDIGPSALFLLEKTQGSQDLESYNQKLLEFIGAYRTTYPNDTVSKVENVELRVLASIPATRLDAVDEKLFNGEGKVYIFGATKKESLERFLNRIYDPYRTSVLQKQLFETLPYIWIKKSAGSSRCRGDSCRGLTNWPSEIYISALLNSLHFNLFVSGHEALLQGDLLLPMIHKAVNSKAASSNDPQKELSNRAYELLSVNAILRENYLRYLLYRSYKNYTRAMYRLHYYFLNDLNQLKPYIGSIWSFERKVIDSKKNSEDKVLHIKMPCIEKFGTTEWSNCAYPLPAPDTFVSFEFKHSLATKELARARAQGNRLLSVLQSYHPENSRINEAGL